MQASAIRFSLSVARVHVKVELLISTALIVDVAEKWPTRGAFVACARDDHISTDATASNAVNLVVDELPR